MNTHFDMLQTVATRDLISQREGITYHFEPTVFVIDLVFRTNITSYEYAISTILSIYF